ncbi:MAG: hypothetical protein M1538_01805 [Candidatus Marsarchaeota archaeon]|jgi:hypothetical protein|nr:hypothetical protein [Candidatus Marsarchaeota archaeon]
MTSDPIESTAKGVTEGLLEWSKDEIKDFIIKFKNKNISFLEDPKIIQIVSEERKTTESELFHKYIKDLNFRTMAILGLTLRKIEKDKSSELQKYRVKIKRKYGTAGLHIVEFFQHGLFSRYIGVMGEFFTSTVDLEKGIDELLSNIEKYVIFIQDNNEEKKICDEIKIRIQANQPSSFIIAGAGGAKNKARKIFDCVFNKISGYVYEKSEDELRITIFLKRS